MDMHYCDIFGDCYHCPAVYCPYEKSELSGMDTPCPVDDGGGSEDADLQD
jgi:hypothetical protein